MGGRAWLRGPIRQIHPTCSQAQELSQSGMLITKLVSVRRSVWASGRGQPGYHHGESVRVALILSMQEYPDLGPVR